MEEIQNFYLKILSELRTMQTKRIQKERLLPHEHIYKASKKEIRLTKKFFKKSEKQRKKIEKGYYKGVQDSINLVEMIYKKVLKCSSND